MSHNSKPGTFSYSMLKEYGKKKRASSHKGIHTRYRHRFFDQIGYQTMYSLLNKYETAPNLNQLSQNLTSECWLISVYLPVFTSFCIL